MTLICVTCSCNFAGAFFKFINHDAFLSKIFIILFNGYSSLPKTRSLNMFGVPSFIH